LLNLPSESKDGSYLLSSEISSISDNPVEFAVVSEANQDHRVFHAKAPPGMTPAKEEEKEEVKEEQPIVKETREEKEVAKASHRAYLRRESYQFLKGAIIRWRL